MEERKEPTVEQLKARAYDLLATRERLDNELRAINNMIAKAVKPKAEEPKKEKKEAGN